MGITKFKVQSINKLAAASFLEQFPAEGKLSGDLQNISTWISTDQYTNQTEMQLHIAYFLTIQGGPKITEQHTSGNKDLRWLVSVDGVSSPEKNDTKISHFG